MVSIYSMTIGPRLEYACKIIFDIILNQPYRIITDIQSDEVPEINYSDKNIPGSLNIMPSGLLEQNGLTDFDIQAGEMDNTKTIFHLGKGDVPFDIFSAVFYLCSRYEEYLPFEPDEHGRFKAEDSTAYRLGFINEPVVEQWAFILAEKIGIEQSTADYKVKLTIDVDDAWKYRNRPLLHNTGALARDFLTFQWKAFTERLSVLLRIKPDPWFTFDYLKGLEDKLSEPIQYFILLGRKSPYDRAISSRKKAFRKFIKGLQQRNKVGIHPSYASNTSLKQLQKEFYNLSYIVKNKPQQSRQHFLKMKMPLTHRYLIRLGILEDYSMGWASQTGFRLGCSRPVPFYDLKEEKQTHLMLVPFIAMDRTLKDYLGLSTEEAKHHLGRLRDTVKQVGGHFTVLYHNDSMSDTGEWKGWRSVFESHLGMEAK